MKPSKRKELYSLIEQQTRCYIMARLKPLGWQEAADYDLMAREKLDKIRELMFGTSNLVELGQRWGIVEKYKQKQKQKTRNTLNNEDSIKYISKALRDKKK
jgi:hypothetical protein